jgi:hypothetical protein
MNAQDTKKRIDWLMRLAQMASITVGIISGLGADLMHPLARAVSAAVAIAFCGEPARLRHDPNALRRTR